MKHVQIYLFFLLFGYCAGGQPVIYTLQQTSETHQLNGKTVTTNIDTTTYRLTVSDPTMKGPMTLQLSLLSYTCRVNVTSNGNQLVNYYYTTEKKKWDNRYQIAFDNLDGTRGTLRKKEVKIFFDPAKDTLYVLNADSIVNSLPGVPFGLLENVRSYFSNDYFTGFFNAFLRTDFQSHREVNAQWTREMKQVSELQPRYADRTYSTVLVNSDSTRVAVTGTSQYRDLTNAYTILGPKYCTGNESGTIVYRNNGWIPWRIDMHYQLVFPKNRNSDLEETWIADTRIQFINK